MKESVLVTGASNQLGVFLLPRLQTAGFSVLAVSRKSPLTPLEVSPGVYWSRPESPTEPDCMPVRRLVSCGPIGLACETLDRHPDLEQIVAFSTSSVVTKAGSRNRAECEQMATIASAEERLVNLCESRKIALLMLRPTMIWGCGLDRNISLLARFGRRFGFIPLAGAASGLRQPVHADDLAAVAVKALSEEPRLRLESVACGGSTLSYRSMVKKIAGACGESVRVVTLPPRLMMASVRVLSSLPSFHGINIEMVRRQGQDLAFDDKALRSVLDYQPRPFEPVAADFFVPEYTRVLQLPA